MEFAALNKVSLVVTTFNEEASIEKCLSSAEGVGEIVLVDSFSTDKTVEIAERLGARIFQREYRSAADQKNWAIDRANGEWILILDGDEALSPELKREITDVLREPKVDGYWLKRRSEFLGKKIKHCGWGNDKVLRLFKKGSGRYRAREIHEKLGLNGKAMILEGYIYHRPYKDLGSYMEKLRSYSYRGAKQRLKEGKGWFPQIIFNPFFRFVRTYILQLGFLDGMHGFVLCVLASFSVFMKYAALMELKLGIKK